MKKHLTTFACTVAVMGLALTGCGNSGSDAPSDGTAANQVDSADSSTNESTFENDILSTPELTIEITDIRTIAPGEEGNSYGEKPVIAFWYNTTNLTDNDTDPTMAWISHFSAYQDNDPNAVNKIDMASLPDSQFLDTQMETIKKGGTVPNATAYELDDETTPVELVASSGLGLSEIGRITYDLP